VRSIARIPLWIWWIPVVWIVSFPVGLTAEPQWHRVHVVPFTDPADKFRDLTVNLALFIPFGYSFAKRSRSVMYLLIAAVATSATAEVFQLFSTVRYPSGTDVVYASVGALVGALLAAAARKYRS
jgi:glycopeptide antibiotics resistance protein